MKLLASLAVCWSLFCLSQAHIHSQKVSIEKEKLTVHTWLCALVSSALVGVCGVFPLLINRWIKLDKTCSDRLGFKAVLSFAVGGLLGDVFLHLLPEAYGTGSSDHGHGTAIGLWVLVGLLSFLVVEKVVKATEKEEGEGGDSSNGGDCGGCEEVTTLREIHHNSNSNCSVAGSNGKLSRRVHTRNGTAKMNGSISGSLTHKSGPLLKQDSSVHPNQIASEKNSKKLLLDKDVDRIASEADTKNPWLDKDISGYLNLVANSTDNFTHGLAIAASYVASPAVGVLTTLAILCHEVPHEVGDFAILLNSGFSLREAAKAQMLTACGGLVGVVVGLTAEHVSSASDWLLPFTAGGFLYIALVSIVPGLLECTNWKHSVLEVLALGVGIGVMALVTVVEKKSCGYMPPDTT